MLGVIVGICAVILIDTYAVAIAAAAVAAVLAAALFTAKKKRAALFFLCILLGTSAGAASAAGTVAGIQSSAFYAENVTVTARIAYGNASSLDGKVTSAYVTVDDIYADGVKLEGKATLYSPLLSKGGFSEGDVIEFTASRIGSSDGEVGDGYAANDLSKGVYHTIAVDDEGDEPIRIVGSEQTVFDKIRASVASVLMKNMREDTAEFAYAMLFGQPGVMSDEVRETFSATGTAHLLAVSGLHVAMLAAAVAGILKKLRLGPYIRFAALTAVLLGFTALCGFSASVVRAFVMIEILQIGGLTGGRYDPLSSLSLAAALILAFSPFSLFTLGFLMSFAAVFGIVLFDAPIKRKLIGAKIPAPIASMIATTVSSNIGLLPITVYTFGSTSLVFMLSNMLVLPLVSFAFPLFLGALLLAFVPFLGWILSAVSLFFTAVVYLVQATAELDLLRTDLALDWYSIVIYFALLMLISRFSFAHVQAKKILASVLIIGFSVNVIAQSAQAWIFPQRAVCMESDEAVGAVLISGDRAYIAASGEADDDLLSSIEAILKDMRTSAVTFIKSDLTEAESELLRSRSAAIGLTAICTNSEVDPWEGVTILSSLDDGEATALFYGSSVMCYFSGVAILASFGEPPSAAAENADILICNYAAQPIFDGQYVVSERSYTYSYANSVPSDFTFGLNGGKIKKITKWSFV